VLWEALTPVCCTLPGLPGLGEVEVPLAALAALVSLLDAAAATLEDASEDVALTVVTPVTVPEV